MVIQSKSRTFVNILGIPGLLALIYLGDIWFTGLILTVMIIGGYELKNIALGKGANLPISLLSVFFIILAMNNYYFPVNLYNLSILLIIMSFTGIIIELFRKEDTPLLNVSIEIFGFMWIGIFLGSLISLRLMSDIGIHFTFILMVGVWACDSAAFLFGKTFGEKKILPKVSPKKTWVGCISGIVFTNVTILIIAYYNDSITFTDAVVISVIIGVFGQIGDFVESMFKREVGVKDTGSLLMGHGGALDRFDSLALAAPVTFLYVIYSRGLLF